MKRRKATGTVFVFTFTTCSKNDQASSDQRPPISMAVTTSLQRLELSSSGYLFSFRCRAALCMRL